MILAICGSSREKNTVYMMNKVLKASNQDFDFVMLKDLNIDDCLNCKGCHDSFECLQNDDMKVLHQKMKQADAILLGSPTYFDNVSGRMKMFFDRCLRFYFSGELEGKKVGLVTCGGFKNLVERDDKNECVWCKDGKLCKRTVKRCIDSMKYFCEHLGMDIVGSVYSCHGEPGLKDKELEELGKKLK